MDTVHPTISRFLDAWKAQDYETYIAAFAPQFVCLDPYGVTRTHDEVKGHFDASAETWEDLDYTFTDVVGEGERQAVAYTIAMTGKANGWEGQRVKLDCITIVELKDGLISKWTEAFDTGVLRRARKRKEG